jgi:hypothetical protein
MAISRKSNPAAYNPISQYVALPIDYLSARLNNAQQEYNVNKAAELSFIETIGKVRARERDRGALQNISSAYENALQGIAEKVNRDYGSSNYRQELQKLAGNLRTDLAQGDLYAINSNYNTYQAYQDQVKKTEGYDKLLDAEYTNLDDEFYQGYKGANGYNISRLGSINKGINAFEEADKVVKGINSISEEGYQVITDPTTGNRQIINTKGEYIDDRKIRNTFREGYQNTPAYNQLVDKVRQKAKIAERRGQNYDPQADLTSQLTEIENSLVNKYLMSKESRSTEFKDAPEWQQDKNKSLGSTSIGTTEVYQNPTIAPNIPKISFDASGRPMAPKGLRQDVRGGFVGSGTVGGGNVFAGEFSSGDDKEAHDKNLKFLQDLKTNNPQLSTLPDKQAYEVYMQAVTNNSRIASPTAEVNYENRREAMSNKVFKGGINTRGISVIASNAANTKAAGLANVAKDLGLGKDELRDQLNNGRVTGYVNGTSPGQFKTTIIDKNGSPVTLAVDGDKDQQRYFMRSFNMTKLERENKTGKTKFIDPVDGTPYVSETRLVQDPATGNWNFKTVASQAQNDKDGDYSINTSVPPIINFDEILREDANRFEESEFSEKTK